MSNEYKIFHKKKKELRFLECLTKHDKNLVVGHLYSNRSISRFPTELSPLFVLIQLHRITYAKRHPGMSFKNISPI